MTIRLTAADAAALLGAAEPEPEVADVFARAGVDGLFLVLDVEPVDGVGVMVAAMNAAATAPDRREHRRFLRLAIGIKDQLARQGVHMGVDPEQFVAPLVDDNGSSREDLGGFTSHQVHRLLDSSWTPDGPGLRLHRAGALEEVDGSEFLHNARVLLSALADGGTRATPKLNLNRAFVAQLLAAMRWPDGYIDDLYDCYKVLNEKDCRRLHELRVMVDVAKLVTVSQGRFQVTDSGRRLVDPARAGELHELLVRTVFRAYNLGYGDRLPDWLDFQHTIAFPLAVLARLDDGWHDHAELAPRLLLPAVAAQVPPPLPELYDWRAGLVELRLVKPLAGLGLLTCRHVVDKHYRTRRLTHVRKTPLYDRVFSLGCDTGCDTAPCPNRPRARS